jgi:hypothetical protein
MNPGSKEAQDAGCTCPILDNEYGKGVYVENGKPVFWIVQGCPLHDTKEWLHA